MRGEYDGFLVIDKPAGLTSRDVVDRAQRWFPARTRLGHTGTLDPLATGVLVLAVGLGTRLAEYVQAMPKTYLAGILLGSRSDTDDADGAVVPLAVPCPPDRQTLDQTIQLFVGEQEQVPPAYSAAKVKGRRAYQLARKGKDVDLQPRKVQVHSIDVLAYAYPHLELNIRCSKGTYIRSLARDLGERLGCGGLVESLRRTSVGKFHAAEGLGLEGDAGTALSRLLPLSAAVTDLPAFTLSFPQLDRFCQGQAVPLTPLPDPCTLPVAVFDDQGNLVAIGEPDPVHQQLKPAKVFLPGSPGRIAATPPLPRVAGEQLETTG